MKKFDFEKQTAFIDKLKDIRILVCVLVYNRPYNIDRWLWAWNRSEKLNAKICVIQSYDQPPTKAIVENVIKHNPDYYIQRPNVGRDIGALQDIVLRDRDPYTKLPKWDVLYWSTDDSLPATPQFLCHFIDKVERGHHLVGGFFSPGLNGYRRRGIPIWDHFRTNVFCLTREFADVLRFPSYPITDARRHPYHFEHGDEGLLRQAINGPWNPTLARSDLSEVQAHFERQCICDGHRKWCEVAHRSDLIWDCHSHYDKFSWEKFHNAFGN